MPQLVFGNKKGPLRSPHLSDSRGTLPGSPLAGFMHVWWSLPVSGLIIGYFTNWLAITMPLDSKLPQRAQVSNI